MDPDTRERPRRPPPCAAAWILTTRRRQHSDTAADSDDTMQAQEMDGAPQQGRTLLQDAPTRARFATSDRRKREHHGTYKRCERTQLQGL